MTGFCHSETRVLVIIAFGGSVSYLRFTKITFSFPEDNKKLTNNITIFRHVDIIRNSKDAVIPFEADSFF